MSKTKQTKSAKAKADPSEAISFEQRLQKLEQLVEELESGELELSDSLDRFKQGVEISNQCQSMLNQAQQTIEKLSDPDDESSATAFTLEPSANAS